MAIPTQCLVDHYSPFIFWPLYCQSFFHLPLVPLLSFGHCIVNHSSIYLRKVLGYQMEIRSGKWKNDWQCSGQKIKGEQVVNGRMIDNTVADLVQWNKIQKAKNTGLWSTSVCLESDASDWWRFWKMMFLFPRVVISSFIHI
jgi:hypothetical protein